MHRAEVALEVLDLDAGLVVELVQLEVLAPAHEDLLVLVQGGGVGGARNADLLELVELGGVEEDDLVSGGHGEDLPVPGHLHAPDLVRGHEAPDLAPGGGVPHPHSLVIAAAHQLLVVRSVHHLSKTCH